MKLKNHPGIDIDPSVCHGKPVVAGTRITVAQILATLASGQSREELLEDFPSLTPEGIDAALAFGSSLSGFEDLTPETVPAS